MKNKLNFIIVVFGLLTIILGCNFNNPLSQKSKNNGNPANKEIINPIENEEQPTNPKTDEIADEDRIGIPECDELLDFFAEQTKSEDENYIVKATREFYFNQIRESIRKDLEKNKNSPNKKEEMTKNCRDYKKQLDKFKAEEDQKKESAQ